MPEKDLKIKTQNVTLEVSLGLLDNAQTHQFSSIY